MKNTYLRIFVFLLFIMIFSLVFFFSNGKNIAFNTYTKLKQPILFSNSYPVVTTFGKPLEDERLQTIDFKEWEEQKEFLIGNSDIFLFDETEFQNEKNHNLIKELVNQKKTVLFYGFRLDIPSLLKDKENLIPFYTVHSDKKLYHFLYGYGFSKNANKQLPITVMGNFSKKDMNKHLTNYIYKYFHEELK